MKKLLVSFVIISTSVLLISWGSFGHEHINRAAVLALPATLQTFFYNHIDFITQESTIPDLRKYTLNDKAENPRHYMDLENFGSVDSLPQTMKEAKEKYDEKFLNKNGILYWYMQEVMEKLTKAFKEKRKTEILFLAADLGHYVGDAHMPLHTSDNHDGQLTGQKGIHALWESRLPEMFGKNYNYKVPEAKYIDNVQKEVWRMISSSHKLVDTLLLIDKQVRKNFTEETMFKKDSLKKTVKNKFGALVFSNEYASQLNVSLNGMVEKQLSAAITATASLWYTAWVNAGKPDLNELDPKELTERNMKTLKEELELWKKGKLFGIESEKEF